MATFQERSGAVRVLIRKSGYPAITKTFDNKTQAKAWAIEVEAKMNAGSYKDTREAENLSVGEALDKYEKEESVEKKGYRQEANRIKLLKKYPITQFSMLTLTVEGVSKYVQQRKAEGMSSSTITKELAIISHLYTVARSKWGMSFLENPVIRGLRPKASKGRDRRLEEGELEKLLKFSKNNTMKTIITLAVETAMRRTEIINISLKNINFKERRITLHNTKNGETRHVPLTIEAVFALNSYIEDNGITDKLFNITENYVTHQFIDICKRAKIDNLKFHDLRHEATSRLFERGLTEMEVASITGHKTNAMLRRYTHLSQKYIVEKLDKNPYISN